MQIGDLFHLTYCTNIHPGETWRDVFANLQMYLPAIRAEVASGKPTGIGLRLSHQAACELLSSNCLIMFQEWLAQNALYVFTLNGFPYGGFHNQAVKAGVYAPDWRYQARYDYTLMLAQILARLLPPDMEGSISTLPISYRPWYCTPGEQQQALVQSCLYLAELALALSHIEQTHGKRLHVDLEPEPDCLLQNSQDVIDFFNDWLLPLGTQHLTRRAQIPAPQGSELIQRHIQLCFDTCHFAVAFERADEALTRLEQAGIHIGKVQLSSALKVRLPDDSGESAQLQKELGAFADAVYLHQVVARATDGRLHRYPDLAAALPALGQSGGQEWRIHFHVPIFLEQFGLFASTQAELSEALAIIRSRALCPHLEIETYTWSVLPEELRTDLLSSIKREYNWVMQHFAEP